MPHRRLLPAPCTSIPYVSLGLRMPEIRARLDVENMFWERLAELFVKTRTPAKAVHMLGFADSPSLRGLSKRPIDRTSAAVIYRADVGTIHSKGPEIRVAVPNKRGRATLVTPSDVTKTVTEGIRQAVLDFMGQAFGPTENCFSVPYLPGSFNSLLDFIAPGVVGAKPSLDPYVADAGALLGNTVTSFLFELCMRARRLSSASMLLAMWLSPYTGS